MNKTDITRLCRGLATRTAFNYSDIVTEGFRTIRTGERVRFLTDSFDAGHATYVIRLDLPDVEAYYE